MYSQYTEIKNNIKHDHKTCTKCVCEKKCSCHKQEDKCAMKCLCD